MTAIPFINNPNTLVAPDWSTIFGTLFRSQDCTCVMCTNTYTNNNMIISF